MSGARLGLLVCALVALLAAAAPAAFASATPTFGLKTAAVLTNAPPVTITGKSDPRASVEVLAGTTSLVTVTADATSGVWSIDLTTDGTYVLSAVATDAAGNPSPASSPVTVRVDTAAPAAPAITAPVDGSWSTTSGVDISGTAEKSATVEVFDGSTSLGTVGADPSTGAWTKHVTFADGAHALTAKASDAAGNVSPASGTVTVKVDTVPPAAPAITAPVDGSWSTVSGVDVSGTAEKGASVEVFDGSTSLGTVGADPSTGIWTKHVTFADGAHALTAKASDAAGNVSPASGTVTVKVDTVPPAAPAITAPVDGSWSTVSGVDVSGTAEKGASVEVFDGSTALGSVGADPSTGIWTKHVTFADGDHALTAKASDAAGNASPASSPAVTLRVDTAPPAKPSLTAPLWSKSTSVTASGTAEAGSTVEVLDGTTSLGTASADGTTGAWSKTLTLAEGPHSLTATATDAAGNVSAASSAAPVTVDLTPPAAPAITAPVDGSWSTTSGVDISGSAEKGATVEVSDGSTSLGTVSADPSTGAWTKHVTFSDGAHTLTAKATDAAGNVSPASSSVTVKVDTSAPNAPAITAPADGSWSKVSGVDISGTADPGTTVEVFDGSTSLGTSSPDPSTGAWTKHVTFSDGAHTLTAKASDAAGNVSTASSPVTVNVDTQRPAAPAITAPADQSWSTSSTVTVSGTAEPGSTVNVLDAGTSIGPPATAGTNGAWSVQLTALADGTHTLAATATDAAGNLSDASPTVTVKVDTKPPAAPVIITPADGGRLLSPSALIVGTAEGNATVEVFDGTTSKGTTTAGNSGSWSLQLTGVADGRHIYTAKAKDAAGNVSPASTSRTVTVDGSLPVTTILSAPPSATTSGSATLSFSSSKSGSSFVCKLDGPGSVTRPFDTCGSPATYSGLAPGAYTFTVRATDTVGHVENAPPARSWTVVSSFSPPPAAPPAPVTSQTLTSPPAPSTSASVPSQTAPAGSAEALAAKVLTGTVTPLDAFGSLTGVTVVGTKQMASGTVTVAPTTATQPLVVVGCVRACVLTVDQQLLVDPSTSAAAAATRRIRLPRQTVSLRAGRSRLLHLKLTAAQRKAVAAARNPRLVITVRPKDGKATTATFRLRVRAAKKR